MQLPGIVLISAGDMGIKSQSALRSKGLCSDFHISRVLFLMRPVRFVAEMRRFLGEKNEIQKLRCKIATGQDRVISFACPHDRSKETNAVFSFGYGFWHRECSCSLGFGSENTAEKELLTQHNVDAWFQCIC